MATPKMPPNRKQQELMFWALLNPSKTQRELARDLGYSESWVSVLMSSDMFRDEMNKLRDTYQSTAFIPVRSKAEAAAGLAVDRLMDILENDKENALSPGYILEAAIKLLERVEKMSGPTSAPQPQGGVAVNVGIAQEIHEAVGKARDVQTRITSLSVEPQGSHNGQKVLDQPPEDYTVEPV